VQSVKSVDHPTLLISLGTSPAIVPEAFLHPDIRFTSVHVLTTEKPSVGLIQEFFRLHAPDCRLTLTRVAGFSDFTSESDHFHFEEVLLRWILDSNTRPEDRQFCLSGGFKTMSAAVQRAAAVLGAADVFHVLADSSYTGPDGKSRPPDTVAEIVQSRDEGHLHFIRLGREAGWPQLRCVGTSDYPLETVTDADGVRRVRAPDQRLRQRIHEIMERSHRIAESWAQLPGLPFAELATWSTESLAWLGSPVDPDTDREWIARLPKLELHCHLGGFATDGPALERIRAAAANPDALPKLQPLNRPSDWPVPAQPIGLEPYRHLGDNNGSGLLRDPGCLQEQCRSLYAHLVGQGVVYAEIRCSPANYSSHDRSPWDVLCDIRDTFQVSMTEGAARGEARCHINLIIIGTRQSSGDFRAGISRHLALAVTAAEHWWDPDTCRVVGVDLAGYEDISTRAHYFREEFTAIHRCGLALTVHAGENDDAEGIWRAVFDLNARRIGHALSLADSPELIRSMADRGIAVEMCPHANLQIRGFRPVHPGRPEYPLLDYLRRGIRVTINTDNIGISEASLTDNLLLAARLCPGLTRLNLLQLQRNSLDAAFIDPPTRTALTRRLSSLLPHP
jgi:adenosine deaminase